MSVSLLRVSLGCSMLPLVAGALFVACKGEPGEADPTTRRSSAAAGRSVTAQIGSTPAGTSGAPGAGGMRGMSGMQGMNGGVGGMMGDGMMAQMQTHMRTMQGAGADNMKAMLPTHRQMVANMLARMNGEMRQMHMATDAGWAATVDSLRQDLVRLPELSAAELRTTMPAHLKRVARLGEMHQQMMRDMTQ